MKLRQNSVGFTLIELLVVISIIAILASVAVPASMGVIEKGKQMKDLSNAGQIHKALVSFAGDHDGSFPSQRDQDGTAPQDLGSGSTANDAYANLVPQYLGSENIFWVSGSAWCKSTPPDENVSSGNKLAAGENNFAYVTGLNTSSNPNYPIVADGFSTYVGVYAKDPAKPGGLWKGTKAIVVRVGGSAVAENLRSTDYRVYGGTGGNAKQDIFSTSGGTDDNPWLNAQRNFILNPTPYNY